MGTWEPKQANLFSRLSQQNVCSMLVLADIHNAEMLMNACIPLVRIYLFKFKFKDDDEDI